MFIDREAGSAEIGQPGMTVTFRMPSSYIQARTISIAVSFFGMVPPARYVSAGGSVVINRATQSPRLRAAGVTTLDALDGDEPPRPD